MFSFMIYVIVPEYVVKFINILYDYIAFCFQIPSRLAQKSHNNASLNPFQPNFSANRILPSSYLFWTVKRLVDYL
jgi:hypothetical protein